VDKGWKGGGLQYRTPATHACMHTVVPACRHEGCMQQHARTRWGTAHVTGVGQLCAGQGAGRGSSYDVRHHPPLTDPGTDDPISHPSIKHASHCKVCFPCGRVVVAVTPARGLSACNGQGGGGGGRYQPNAQDTLYKTPSPAPPARPTRKVAAGTGTWHAAAYCTYCTSVHSHRQGPQAGHPVPLALCTSQKQRCFGGGGHTPSAPPGARHTAWHPYLSATWCVAVPAGTTRLRLTTVDASGRADTGRCGRVCIPRLHNPPGPGRTPARTCATHTQLLAPMLWASAPPGPVRTARHSAPSALAASAPAVVHRGTKTTPRPYWEHQRSALR
jgi:hypothetical protein